MWLEMPCRPPISGCTRKAEGSKYYYFQCQGPGDLPEVISRADTWLKDIKAAYWLRYIVPTVASIMIGVFAAMVLLIVTWITIRYLQIWHLRSIQLREMEEQKKTKAMHLSFVDESMRATMNNVEVQTEVVHDTAHGVPAIASEVDTTDGLDIVSIDDTEDDEDEVYGILTGRKRKKQRTGQRPAHQREPKVKKPGAVNILHRVREGVLGKQQHHRSIGTNAKTEEEKANTNL